MLVGVLISCHTQYCAFEIGVCVFYNLIKQHSKFLFHTLHNPELKVRNRMAIETISCYREYEANSIIVLMFVESKKIHIQSNSKICNK